jgi:hypothetical protein
MDSISIAAGFGALKHLKEISEIVKDYKNADLLAKIVSLQTDLLQLSEERLALYSKCKELEEKLALKNNFTFKSPVYFADGDKVPFCPICYEDKGKNIHLISCTAADTNRPYYLCNVCQWNYDL